MIKPTATPGADVRYVVENTFTAANSGSKSEADQIKSRAQETLKDWHYQFGSDSHLSCMDKTDYECKKALPGRWVYKPPGGPVFQVWALENSSFPNNLPDFFPGSQSCSEVSIAFRGTFGLNKSDWVANAHMLTRGHFVDDHYKQLHRNIDGIIRKITELDCFKRASAPRIVAVGHSLGGGLAQLAALANKRSPRIGKVFAFDPSPVTGANLVDQQTLAENSKGLEIDRIFQEGEILQPAREWLQAYPPSKHPCDPRVRKVTVDAWRGGGVDRHGIGKLAAALVDLSYEFVNTHQIPTSHGCPTPTRYERELVAGRQLTAPVAAASSAPRDFYALWPDSGERPRVIKSRVSFKSPPKPASDTGDSFLNLVFGGAFGP
jgi:pimeloyl-ACP methyl ester carboxylesterase